LQARLNAWPRGNDNTNTRDYAPLFLLGGGVDGCDNVAFQEPVYGDYNGLARISTRAA
jgi:hypothetical protein